jgi:hypothetical protein
MKLDNKQMHIVSQLFMAAGKAGHPFDLARFTKESGYASETMAKLSLLANAQKNDALQSLTAVAMDLMSNVVITSTPVSTPTPLVTEPPVATVNPQKYVGGLR